ncbi:hypothetical protein [Selenomonas sp. AB3002]|uniref:hypothetical protein n=1 Tax=Selenomonas sp. AB3002 TaxID=1392502 RepID=UPI000495B004
MTYEMKMREAHDDGMEEGIEKGKEEANVNTAIKMLRKNKPVEEIVEFTELTKERVEELASQIKG